MVRLMIKNNMVWGMVWVMQNIQFKFVEMYFVVILQLVCWCKFFDVWKVEYFVLLCYFVDLESVVLMWFFDWYVCLFCQCCDVIGMVDVVVCNKNFGQCQFFIFNCLEYVIDIVIRVNNCCLMGFFVLENGVVLFEGSDWNNYVVYFLIVMFILG